MMNLQWQDQDPASSFFGWRMSTGAGVFDKFDFNTEPPLTRNISQKIIKEDKQPKNTKHLLIILIILIILAIIWFLLK